MSSLPKPFGIYSYSIPDNKGWAVGVLKSEQGWAIVIRNPLGEPVRVCEFYPSKSDAIDIVVRELKSLGFKKKEIQGLKNTDSYYEYRTYPVIKIYSKRSKWGWKCGDKRGVEKTKKLALDKACKYRKDGQRPAD